MFRMIVDLLHKVSGILKYPLVQYIPLTIRTIGKSDNWSNPFHQPSAQFFLFQDAAALQSALTRYHASASVPHPSPDDMFILALNFQADIALFRYLTCKIIGKSTLNSYHIFIITKRYFPRRKLHFALYESSGQLLRWLNEEVY